MIDMRITAVLNPKGKKYAEGEANLFMHKSQSPAYIHLKLDKIPKNAWSGKPLRWVNRHYLYADFHNRVIAREIHYLKEIIQEYYTRNEILTPKKLKNLYMIKHQGKRIKGVWYFWLLGQVIPLGLMFGIPWISVQLRKRLPELKRCMSL